MPAPSNSTRNHRILCIGSYRDPSNAWRRVLAFRKLGHNVAAIDVSRYHPFRAQVLRKSYRILAGPLANRLLLRSLRAKIKQLTPEIVFLEKSTWLMAGDQQRLKRLSPPGCQWVHYNPDDPFGEYSKGWDQFLQALPLYDVHFVPKAGNVEEYRARGAKRVFPFDRSFDPDLHRPIQLTEAEQRRFGCDIGFIGTWAPHREEMIARLIQSGVPVTVWGNGWPNGRHWPIIRPHWQGPSQTGENYVKAICGMKIALHFLRKENRDEQDSRTFEIPACGTFMLAERTTKHEEFFRDGTEAVFFDTFDELQEHARKFLKNSRERDSIAHQGLNRCLSSGYDHASRLRELIDRIS